MGDRKPKRIKHPRQLEHPYRDDLTHLAEMLDEHRLERNVSGWFTVPWRDGWCAIECACGCFTRNFDQYNSPREHSIDDLLSNALRARKPSAELYYAAGEFLERIDTEEVSPFLYAALRCLQMLISNSSGGGENYNVLLRRAFEKVQEPIELYEDVVLEYRCRDAIGTTAVMQRDAHDDVRRAFAFAWHQGLFHAAYALKPVGGS